MTKKGMEQLILSVIHAKKDKRKGIESNNFSPNVN